MKLHPKGFFSLLREWSYVCARAHPAQFPSSAGLPSRKRWGPLFYSHQSSTLDITKNYLPHIHSSHQSCIFNYLNLINNLINHFYLYSFF